MYQTATQIKRAKAKKGKRRRKISAARASISTVPGTIKAEGGIIEIRIPKKLRTLNALKGWRARYGDTKSWEQAIKDCRTLTDAVGAASIAGMMPLLAVRMRLEILRLAPTKRELLDTTNAAGSVKGLEDALKRLGYIVNDDLDWLDGPYVSQAIAPDRQFWAIIKLSKASSYQVPVYTLPLAA